MVQWRGPAAARLRFWGAVCGAAPAPSAGRREGRGAGGERSGSCGGGWVVVIWADSSGAFGAGQCMVGPLGRAGGAGRRRGAACARAARSASLLESRGQLAPGGSFQNGRGAKARARGTRAVRSSW
ncbi:MAG: hypothetical protein J3K34DRAFT_437896 [Monoraphidium minutum]|nr:MAG: hypothetical protein J3K34DRAFT_437896 [Monoraphidium minutum]